MGLWIEFRCESRRTGCFSDNNGGPMGLSGDDLAAVRRMLRFLRKEGQAAGWRRTRSGWLCPSCRLHTPSPDPTGAKHG